MPINVLGRDGPNLIRLHMEQQASERDRWKLLRINGFETAPDLMPDALLSQITEKFSEHEGKITATENLVMLLIRLDAEKTTKDFLQDVNRMLPEGNIGRVTENKGKKTDIKKITLTIEPIDGVASGNLLKQRAERLEKRALIIDDDDFIRGVFSASLADQFKIIELDSGAEAVDAYKEHQPDIVLLDIHLPDKTGFTILEQLLDEDKDAYVIMVSADSVEKNVLQAKHSGAQGFMTKPARKEKLLEYISRCPTVDYAKLAAGSGSE
ncbi:MAG: response regulator [Pseudomonadota bacterium]